jgi:Fur family transcriptional regulator, ferric uptake regulator
LLQEIRNKPGGWIMRDLMVEATATARAGGGRMTSQRRLILQTLNDLGGHPTADEICAAARQRDASLHPSTVYRTLAWLESARLVDHCHLDAGSENRHSERFDPVTPVEHHHFVCTACNRVIEFEASHVERIKQDFADQYGAAVERSALTLYGLCPACRSVLAAASASASRSHYDKF